MAKAVLLPLLTLCFTGVSDVAAAPGNTVNDLSCQKDENGSTTTHNIKATGSYGIKCPENMSLSPEPVNATADAEVFLTPDDTQTNKCTISKILQGACYGKNAGTNAVVLNVPQLPNASTTFFVHCMEADKKKKGCTIAVVVAAAPRLGPGTCSTPGFRMRLGIESKDEEATFSCGNGRTLQPVGFQQKAYDESCTKEVELPKNLKVTESGGAYKVAVTAPLKQNTTICYVCQKNAEGGASDKCEVSVSISGSAVSEALPMGATARAAVAVGLALVAIVVLPVW